MQQKLNTMPSFSCTFTWQKDDSMVTSRVAYAIQAYKLIFHRVPSHEYWIISNFGYSLNWHENNLVLPSLFISFSPYFMTSRQIFSWHYRLCQILWKKINLKNWFKDFKLFIWTVGLLKCNIKHRSCVQAILQHFYIQGLVRIQDIILSLISKQCHPMFVNDFFYLNIILLISKSLLKIKLFYKISLYIQKKFP